MTLRSLCMPTMVLLFATACPDGGGDGPGGDDGGEGEGEGAVVHFDGDPATLRLAGACPLASRHGGFGAYEQTQFSFVNGEVKDGVVPITVLEETASEGDCRLLRRNNPFCAPACTSGNTCDFDGSCIPFPATLDVGAVAVDNLSEAVSMQATPPGNTYSDTSIATPIFIAGTALRLRIAEGALELFGVGVKALDEEPAWDLSRGEPLTVSWNAPDANTRARVEVRLSVDQHGTTPATLVCDFADTGSGVVPASLVDALLDAGISGFPNGTIARRTVDSVDHDDGCIDFTVSSARAADITVVSP